jgi:hypothetical protein
MHRWFSVFVLLLLTIVTIFISRTSLFSGPVTTLRIDNPTDKYMTIYIDNYAWFGVWPYSYAPFPVPIKTKADHQLAINDEEAIPLILPMNVEAVLINPSYSDYIVWMEKYTAAWNSYHDVFEIWNGKQRIVWPYTAFDDLIVPITWEVWPNQGLPTHIESVRWQKSITLNKLYRYNDFLPAYYAYINGES